MEKVKWEDYKKALLYMSADNTPSLYDNTFPNNCNGGVVKNNVFYKKGDCWNGAVKAPLWTNLESCYDKLTNPTEIHAKHYKPNNDLDDWTGAQILAHCYDRSKDMANIQEGEFLYLVYNGGSHAGVYVGIIDGKRTVVEFTPIWENGCHRTNIADDGTRSYKGIKVAKWQEHGKMPWVIYPETETPPVEQPPAEIPPEEDITLIEVEGDSDENLPWWQRMLIDIMFAIAKAIEAVFPANKE